MIKGKQPEEIRYETRSLPTFQAVVDNTCTSRKLFNIVNDFTPEEEAQYVHAPLQWSKMKTSENTLLLTRFVNALRIKKENGNDVAGPRLTFYSTSDAFFARVFFSFPTEWAEDR
jgi:Skp1 family, dimerisation domain